MPEDFEVGPTGLPRYRYADWRSVLEQLWRTAYGPDADVRAETPDGLLIDSIALLLTQQGDAIQDVWSGSFFRTADQVSLGLLLDMFGRSYLAARATAVDAVWFGDAATVVHDGVGTGPVASVVSTGDSNGDRYAVVEGLAGTGTIPAVADDGAVVVLRINGVTDGNDYVINVDALEQATTTSAGPTSTIATVSAAWAAAIAADEPTWTVLYAGLDPTGLGLIVIDGKGTELIEDGTNLSDPAELDIYPGVRLTMAAEDTGAQIVLAGSLVQIETPALGLEGVVNTQDGELGRDLETPAELRARHVDQLLASGKGTPAAIRAALLDQLPDPLVQYARVDENVRAVTANGLPPHSFEATVVGTATDAQVAAVLFTQKPAGIRSFGDILVTVVDELNEPYEIYFSRGTELYLHLGVTVTAGEGFPTTGDPATAIETAVVLAMSAILGLGQDLYLPAVVGAVAQAVPGISSVVVTADATPLPGDVPTLVASNISVASGAILLVDSSRVAVTVV